MSIITVHVLRTANQYTPSWLARVSAARPPRILRRDRCAQCNTPLARPLPLLVPAPPLPTHSSCPHLPRSSSVQISDSDTAVAHVAFIAPGAAQLTSLGSLPLGHSALDSRTILYRQSDRVGNADHLAGADVCVRGAEAQWRWPQWPLSAAATYRLAMWLTRAGRHQLPGWRWRRCASGAALEPPALAAATSTATATIASQLRPVRARRSTRSTHNTITATAEAAHTDSRTL